MEFFEKLAEGIQSLMSSLSSGWNSLTSGFSGGSGFGRPAQTVQTQDPNFMGPPAPMATTGQGNSPSQFEQRRTMASERLGADFSNAAGQPYVEGRTPSVAYHPQGIMDGIGYVVGSLVGGVVGGFTKHAERGLHNAQRNAIRDMVTRFR